MDWRDIKEFFKDTSKIIILIIIILFLIQYVFSITKVVGNSMYPTLKDEEIMMINKFKYRISKVKRGEIISLKYADTKYLIKRVIGLPGETVKIKNNQIYINDELLKEEYLPNDLEYNDFSLDDLGLTEIPEDMYFVLGDNRENSLDSREIGLIKKADIIGKISIRFWPLNRLTFF
jgi:signal peptidase I